MLVLTRKAGESIMLGDGVRVMVAEVRGNRIRLAIEAPRSTPVHRSEVAASKAAAKATRRQPEPQLV